MGAGSIGVRSDDLEGTLTRVSRSLYAYKSNISNTVRHFQIVQYTIIDHQGFYRKRLKIRSRRLKYFWLTGRNVFLRR